MSLLVLPSHHPSVGALRGGDHRAEDLPIGESASIRSCPPHLPDHNNQLAFRISARHGLRWWQIDMTCGVIPLLSQVKIARGISLPQAARNPYLLLSSAEFQGRRGGHVPRLVSSMPCGSMEWRRLSASIAPSEQR